MGSIFMILVNKLNIIFVIFIYIKGNLGEYNFEDSHLSDSLIKELYWKYKEAVNNDSDLVILRRQLNQNRLFEIHIKKLKEVNGYKKHNLIIKGKARSGQNPFIYINNPVESKIPNAYLTLEEFKDALTKRVEKQRFKTTPRRYALVVNTDRIKKKKPTLISRNLHESRSNTQISTGTFRNFNKTTATITQKITNTLIVSDKISSVATKSSWINQTDEVVETTEPLTIDINLERNYSSTANIEELIFLRASPSVDVHNTGISKNNHSTETEYNLHSLITDANERTEIPYVSEITNYNVTDIDPISDRSISFDNNATEGIIETNSNIINKTTNMLELTSNGTTENPIITENATSEHVISTTVILTNFSQKTLLTYVKDVETTEVPLESVNTTLVMGNTNMSLETTKNLPKRFVTKLETVSFGRHTPWRKRTLSNKKLSKSTSAKTKRPTLGRPLVFIGGP